MIGQNDDKQRVLAATDIVRLIGEHVTLRAKGREYVALCPFHDDHTPSMYVVPHKQIYHCFVCGAGGDAITFLRTYHKLEFGEALERLAERAGVELTPWRPAERRAGAGPGEGAAGAGDGSGTGRSVRRALLDVNATASGFFRRILAHEHHGRAARELVARRGISPEMVETFELGASADQWELLRETISRKGMDQEPFVAAGLLKRRGDGSAYDAMRNRLIFPIHDALGRVIAFGGRRINDEDEPKYLNSSESAVFDKSATLYGLHLAAQAIRRERVAVVTEGYMDTIACHQAGVTNVVATLGTALTPAGARALVHRCDTVVLLFDGDEAGQRAADRAVEVFFTQPIDVKIAVLAGETDAKDPDELLKREGGVEVFRRVVANAKDALEFRLGRVQEQIKGRGISSKARIIEEELARLADLGLNNVQPVRKRLIIRRLGEMLGVDEATIMRAVPSRPVRRAVVVGGADGGAVDGGERHRPRSSCEHLLGCVLCRGELAWGLSEEAAWATMPERFDDPSSRAVASAMHEVLVEGAAPTLSAVLTLVEDLSVQRHAVALAEAVEELTGGVAERINAHWNEHLAVVTRGKAREAGGGGEGDDTMVSRIERLRRMHEEAGMDQRRLPRPATG